jgi:hypothetical protein
MIIKPSRRGGFKAFSDYLAGEGGNQYENEAVNFVAAGNTSGVGNINDWCIFADHIAQPRRHGKYPLRKPIEHISIRTRKGDILTPEMIQSKIPALLKKMGYENCPWLLVQHIKGGEPHYHLGILRIDDKGTVPNPKSQKVCFDLAQKFARELGFKPAFDGAKGSRYAQEYDHLARLWAETAKLSPAERLKRFQQAGFTPARHDRRPEVVFIDRNGKPHSLHRIPALRAMGLRPSDITAAFGFNKAKLSALPSVKEVLATIRRNAHAGRPARGKILAFTRVRKVYSRSLSKMRPRHDVGPTKRSSIIYLLIGLWAISRCLEHNQLRPVRGEGSGIKPHRLKDFNPTSIAGAPRLRATGASDVQYKAWGVFRSMIAAGASPEQAQKAVEAVYLEEDQRLAAEQRYLDWVYGVGGKNGGKDPADSPRDSPMRHGKLL